MDGLFSITFFASIIALVIGLIRPATFSRFIKGEISRKKTSLIFGTAAIVSLVLFAVTTDDTKKNTELVPQPVVEKTSDDIIPTTTQKAANPATNEIQIPPTAPSETVSQKNAVKKAKSYLGFTAFSRDGLVAQLEFEKFTHVDALYGANNSGADWNEQAAKKAKQSMDISAYSRGSLIEQLMFEKFTQAQAEFGANSVGL